MTKVIELYGHPTSQSLDWSDIASGQHCPFLSRKCLKNRKSEPDITIGTCTVSYGKEAEILLFVHFGFLSAAKFLLIAFIC